MVYKHHVADIPKDVVAAIRASQKALIDHAKSLLSDLETEKIDKDGYVHKIILRETEDMYGKAALIADWLSRHFPVVDEKCNRENPNGR